MTISYADFAESWSRLHSGAQPTGVVGKWLHISYRIAKVASALRMTPNFFTFLGVFFAGASAMTSPRIICAIFILISLLCDGIDGSLAIITSRTSRFGSLLDSGADRVAEALWFLALYRLGIAFEISLVGWLLGSFQEYARAKLSSEGVKDLGVVTVAERPIRAALIFLAIVIFHVNFAFPLLDILIWILISLQSIGFIQVLIFARRSLR